MNASKIHTIAILDDDHYPEGRVSDKILPIVKDLGLQNVIHYKTFAELQRDLRSKALSNDSLFVLDSSLDDEPDGRSLEFPRFIPQLIDSLGVGHKNIIPASGGSDGWLNNQWFFDFLDHRDKGWNWGQEGIKSTGMTGKPEQVLKCILEYFDHLYPGELEPETLREIKTGMGVEGVVGLSR